MPKTKNNKNNGHINNTHRRKSNKLRRWIKKNLGKDMPNEVIDKLEKAFESEDLKFADLIKAVDFIKRQDTEERGLKSYSPEILDIVGKHIGIVTDPGDKPLLIDATVVSDDEPKAND